MGQKRPAIGALLWTGNDPPPPILRVPNTKKHVSGTNKFILTNFWSPSSPKFDIFRQKWAKKGHFFAKNRFFALSWTGNDPPPPILRVPNTKKHVSGTNKFILTNFFGPKKAIFLPKIGFLPCRGLATTPPPYFEGAQYKKTRLRNEQVHTDQFLEPVFAKI